MVGAVGYDFPGVLIYGTWRAFEGILVRIVEEKIRGGEGREERSGRKAKKRERRRKERRRKERRRERQKGGENHNGVVRITIASYRGEAEGELYVCSSWEESLSRSHQGLYCIPTPAGLT